MTSVDAGGPQVARDQISQALRSHGSMVHRLSLPIPDRIHLQLYRQEECVTLTAESQVGRRLDDATVTHACQLALPSLRHYRAVVLVDERSNLLRWVRTGLPPQVSAIERALEQLLNQVDIWELLLLRGPVQAGTGLVTVDFSPPRAPLAALREALAQESRDLAMMESRLPRSNSRSV